MRTVFHHADRDSHERVLANAEALLDDDAVVVDEVAVVANADGVQVLTAGSPWSDRVRTLLGESAVRLLACENSLENRDITKHDLLAGVETVPSGVGALTRLQHDGYAYVRV